jgi:hypothetical protein
VKQEYCRANLSALVNRTCFFSSSDIGDFSATSDVERRIQHGDAAVFDLPPLECSPAPTVQWYEGNSQIPLRSGGTDSYHVTLRNQLVILSSRQAVDNNKSWRVTATNRYTQQTVEGPKFILRVDSKSFTLVSLESKRVL